MPTVYVAPPPTGDDARTYLQAQNVATPWATPEKTITDAVSGDTCRYAPGTYASVSHPAYIKPLRNVAQAPGEVVFQAAALEGFVARISSSSPAGTYLFDGLTFDGQAEIARGFAFGESPIRDYAATFNNCRFLDATSRGLQIDGHRGSVTLTNCTFEMSAASGGIVSTADLGDIAGAPFSLTAVNTTLDIIGTGGDTIGISLQRAAVPAAAVTVELRGVKGRAVADGTGAITAVRLQGIDAAVVEGDGELSVVNPNSANEAFGIQATGKNANATADNATVSGHSLTFDSPTGHGIILGRSTLESFSAGGVVENNRVTGAVFPTATPHNISLGRGTSGALRNNDSLDGYIGYLASLTASGVIEDNIAYDCYGSSIYVKGVTDLIVRNNICALSGKTTQRDRGILAVVEQIAINTAAAAIENNRVYVQDPGAIDSLAQIATNQVCQFTSNTYYLPDTVDLATANLFKYKTLNDGDPPNQTFAQWLANPEVTGDQVVLLPTQTLAAIIADLDPRKLPSPTAAGLAASRNRIFLLY